MNFFDPALIPQNFVIAERSDSNRLFRAFSLCSLFKEVLLTSFLLLPIGDHSFSLPLLLRFGGEYRSRTDDLLLAKQAL
jgi:hypothetical protein